MHDIGDFWIVRNPVVLGRPKVYGWIPCKCTLLAASSGQVETGGVSLFVGSLPSQALTKTMEVILRTSASMSWTGTINTLESHRQADF